MQIRVIDHPQRSPEWFAARAGRLTGSRAGDMLAKIKAGEAAARRDYRLQLAVERLTGTPQEIGFVSADMQRGIDMEEAAFSAYEAHSGVMVRRTGFVCSEDYMVGCSLDGDAENFRGVIELKAPKSTTHVGYIKAGVLPATYLPQILHNLWCTSAQWADFASFDDRLPTALQLFVIRVHARDLDIEGYAKEAHKFLAEVDAEVESLTNLRDAA